MASHPPCAAVGGVEGVGGVRGVGGRGPRGQGSACDFDLVVEVLQNKDLVGQSFKRSPGWGWPLG